MDRLRWSRIRRRKTPDPTFIARFAARIFAAGLICLGGAVSAEPAPETGALLRGRVLDTAGAPIAWARVEGRFLNQDPDAAGLTREDGRFELPVKADGVLTTRRLGFHPWSGSYVLADTARELLIRLEPAPRPLAGFEVTALRRPGRSGDLTVPVERISDSALRAWKSPLPALTSLLRQTPEVSAIGRDEYNSAPAIRGLARFRTVVYLDGARLSSDREIGPNAGFVDPATLHSIEIVRGPGSVLYGSDAIGGVILLRSDNGSSGSWAEAGWTSVNRSFRFASGAAAPIDKGVLSLSAARAQAGDHALPGSAWPWSSDARLARNSGFERTTGRVGFLSDGLEASALYSLGENIGRSSPEAEEFTVPREEHLLASLRWRGRRGGTPIEAGGYFHPVSWQAEVLEPRASGIREQQRDYRSIDWGALVTATSAGERGSWVAGLQTDARSGVRIHRRLRDRDSAGVVTSEQLNRWVDGVSVGQVGAFAHGLVRSGMARWNGGARIDAAWREGSARDVRRLIPTGQAGLAIDASRSIVLTANLATAFREATVTELFFAGRRPAGYIEGNPDLRPERSYQGDLGVRLLRGAFSVRASGFGIAVADYIGLHTRAPDLAGAADTLVFSNATRAVLVGGSVEVGTAEAWRGLSCRAFIDAVRASDQEGNPLPDAHPWKGGLEARWTRGAVMTALQWRGALAHRRVGAGEHPVAGYGVLDLHASVPAGPLSLTLSVENALDQEFYERPDPVSYPSPGRAVGLAVGWSAARSGPR